MRNEKYTCAIIRNLSADQKTQWQELWNSSNASHIFNSPKFFDACLEAFRYKKHMIIFCYKEGALCGALPLVEDRIFGIKTLSGPGRKGNYVDKNILLMNKCDLDIFNTIIESALNLGNLYLAEIGEDIKELINNGEFKCAEQWASRSRWETMSKEKNIAENMSRKQRRAMLKRIRDRKNNLDFRLHRTNLKKALKKVFEIEKGSYKSRRHISFFDKEISKKFLKSIAKHSPENVCIGVLYFQNKPISTALGFICGRTFSGYHMAFLKEHYGWGAGKAAIYLTLNHLQKEGFTKIDLLRGDSDLKRQFAKNAADQYNIYISKSRFVLLWWKICIPAMNILKKIKIFIDSLPNRFISARKTFLPALFRIVNILFNAPAIYFVRLKNLFRRILLKNRGKNFINNNKTKKKIVIISSYDDFDNPYYAGGGARAVHEVAKRLAKNFEARVLAGKYDNCPRNKTLDGVYYEYIGSNLLGPKFGQIIFHIMLPFYIRTRTFDIWVENFTPPFSTSFLPIFTKKPVIGLAHMLSAEDMLRKYKMPFNIIENLGIKVYKNFIALTQENSEKIKKLNPQARVEIIPNGVNANPFNDHSDKKHFLFIGRIEINQKGLDLLLEAYKLIEKKTDYSLAIVGHGSSSEEKKLREIIHKFEISNRVKFLGRLEGAAKSKIFQEAIAVIIPSRFETFSLVALESLSQNVPLISFDIEGLKWLPTDFSVKVATFDISCLAQKMLNISAENNLLNIDESKLKKFLSDYNWDVITEKYERYINSIIKTK